MNSLENFLKPPQFKQLSPVLDRAKWLSSIDNALCKKLPAPLNTLCRLANIRDNSLIFITSSPVLATKLRLLTNELLQIANQLTHLSSNQVQIKIDPLLQTSSLFKPPSDAINTVLSPHARKSLQDAAQTIDHLELKKALLRLTEQS